ncbi:MAG: hypothetical protein QXP34_00500 [Candidatus Aenigmatarchaeota archaeon]
MTYSIIRYRKPIDILEVGLENVEEELSKIPNRIYAEEKIDGKLNDDYQSACADLEKYYICFFGEMMKFKDTHILSYKNLPSNRIVFDVAICSEDKCKYIDPKHSTLLTFITGQIFVPIIHIFNDGKEFSIKKIEEFLYNIDSKFLSTINNKLYTTHKDSFDRLFRKKENMIEGVVIKSYTPDGNIISYKYVNPSFEEAKKLFPREKYPPSKFADENIIKPFFAKQFEEYWKEIFKKVNVEEEAKTLINKISLSKIYERYLENYNSERVSEILEEDNIKEEVQRFIEKILGLKKFN